MEKKVCGNKNDEHLDYVSTLKAQVNNATLQRRSHNV